MTTTRGARSRLHGTIRSSEKFISSQQSWLSWSHVASFVEDEVVPLDGFPADTGFIGYQPSLLPYPDGYAIARSDDILWVGNDGAILSVLRLQLAQFRAGVARAAGERSLLIQARAASLALTSPPPFLQCPMRASCGSHATAAAGLIRSSSAQITRPRQAA